jgi:peptide-methionine (R)-S-oxide reductase
MSEVSPGPAAPAQQPGADGPLRRSEQEWRAELGPAAYAVLRQAATEPAFSGQLLHEHRTGIFRCRACGAELFRSDTKFESGSGWPSFYQPAAEHAIDLSVDESYGTRRIEARCARCGSHLGHVFDDAPQTPTGERYCMNSLALRFEAAPDAAGPG